MSVSTDTTDAIQSAIRQYLAKIEPTQLYFLSSVFCAIYALLFFAFYDGIDDGVYSNYLMFAGSVVASVFSALFILTANPLFSLFVISSFIGNFVCELIIGPIYYHSRMGIATGYAHHIAYILLFAIGINTIEHVTVYNLAGLAEVPTALLAAKRIWKIEVPVYDWISAAVFFAFRILTWIPLWLVAFFIDGAHLVEKMVFVAVSLGAGSLHIQWWLKMLTKMAVGNDDRQRESVA